MPVQVRISAPDLNRTLRAFRKLESDAQDLAEQVGQEVAQELADTIRAFAGSQGRQTARAGESVEAIGGNPPRVQAGEAGSALSRILVPGTEFGATRKFGWYRRARYWDSQAKQFPPHRGSNSYWFFRTYEAEKPAAIARYVDRLDEIAREWGSGG